MRVDHDDDKRFITPPTPLPRGVIEGLCNLVVNDEGLIDLVALTETELATLDNETLAELCWIPIKHFAGNDLIEQEKHAHRVCAELDHRGFDSISSHVALLKTTPCLYARITQGVKPNPPPTPPSAARKAVRVVFKALAIVLYFFVVWIIYFTCNPGRYWPLPTGP